VNAIGREEMRDLLDYEDRGERMKVKRGWGWFATYFFLSDCFALWWCEKRGLFYRGIMGRIYMCMCVWRLNGNDVCRLVKMRFFWGMSCFQSSDLVRPKVKTMILIQGFGAVKKNKVLIGFQDQNQYWDCLSGCLDPR